MSVRWYSTTSELVGNTALKRKAARFVLILATMKSASGPKVYRRTEYTVCGTTDAVVEKLAVKMAEEIASLSDGVIVAFHKVMGHYRRDETPAVVPHGVREFGVLTLNNNDIDGARLTHRKIIIPWCKETVTRADLKNMTVAMTDGSDHAEVGLVRWDNDDEVELEAMYCSKVVGAVIGDFEKESKFDLVGDDTATGVADGVLSETF